MEEKELTKARELACKAILARTCLGSAAVTATSMDIEQLDQDFEVEHLTTESGWTSAPNLPQITFVWGRLGWEESYGMELSQWIEYFNRIIEHQGLVCEIPRASEFEIHQDNLVFSIGDIGETPVTSESIQIYIPPRIGRRKTPIHISQNFLNFFLRQNIQVDYLQVAIELAGECFPSLQEMQLQYEKDPDTGEEWLVTEVAVKGDVGEILDYYDKYIDRWVSLVPWPERNKIKLSYNII